MRSCPKMRFVDFNNRWRMWRRSEGATLERRIADALKLNVYEETTMLDVECHREEICGAKEDSQ